MRWDEYPEEIREERKAIHKQWVKDRRDWNKIILSNVLALPFLACLFWVMTVICFGFGLVIPYMMLSDLTDFGNVRITIFGTLILASLIGIAVGFMYLTDNDRLDVDLIYQSGTAQMLLAWLGFYIYTEGLAW